jgi:iron complex transport system permease protein
VGGLVVLVISLSVAISVGAVAVPTSTVCGVLPNKLVPGATEPVWSQGRGAIVWEIRFPSALLVMMAGAGLAIVGSSLQAATRNPLADPHLLEILPAVCSGRSSHSCTAGWFSGC